MQLLLETLLDAELADVVGAPVVAFFFAVFNRLFFSRVDAADVAHHMAAQLAIGITAKQPGLDIDARKTKATRRKSRYFLVRQAGTQRDGFKAF